MKNKKKYNYLAERFINKTNNLSFPYNIYWKTLRIWKNTYLIFHTKEMTKRHWYEIKEMTKQFKGKKWNYDNYNFVLNDIEKYLRKMNFSGNNSFIFVMFERIKRKKIITSSSTTFLI